MIERRKFMEIDYIVIEIGADFCSIFCFNIEVSKQPNWLVDKKMKKKKYYQEEFKSVDH